MENTPESRIIEIVAAQKAFWATGATQSVKFRKEQLRKFQAALLKWEKPLLDALWHDLHKSAEEAFLTETSLVKGEIREHLAHVEGWARRERIRPVPAVLPSRTYVVKEPLGTALIVSPWNYPVQLLLSPLVGAISAGCTAVLKPSPYVPQVSEVLGKMIADTFPENYVALVQGNREVNTILFAQRWDLIFFTGSPKLARTVMAAAAANLTPLVLELGGKSPCIIDKSADVKLAARRVAWGKTLNAGQTCIAPDYILVHEDVKDAFVAEFAKAVEELHGRDIAESKHFVRIVTDAAFKRVSGYLQCGKILYGGRTDAGQRFIEPTLLGDVPLDSPVMTEEIFGPVFPVISVSEKGNSQTGFQGSFADQIAAFVNSREKPLAFYYFGDESCGWELVNRTSSGGGCINDVIMHIANSNAPFGGVGNSGMGHYHGKDSFEAFTHRRTVLASPVKIDLPLRYMPYELIDVAKKLL